MNFLPEASIFLRLPIANKLSEDNFRPLVHYYYNKFLPRYTQLMEIQNFANNYKYLMNIIYQLKKIQPKLSFPFDIIHLIMIIDNFPPFEKLDSQKQHEISLIFRQHFLQLNDFLEKCKVRLNTSLNISKSNQNVKQNFSITEPQNRELPKKFVTPCFESLHPISKNIQSVETSSKLVTKRKTFVSRKKFKFFNKYF